MSPTAYKQRWTFKKILARGFAIYIAFGAGVIFGAGIATLTTLAITGIPEAESVINILVCSE